MSEPAIDSKEQRDLSKPVFWGFMTVGFFSLLGGIAMFIYVVPKDLGSDQAPRDMNVIFTEVFLKQMNYYNENKRYAAALIEIEPDHETCVRYSCRITTQVDGQNYIFRMVKDGHSWALEPKSPVPKLEKL
jgi:hypothetical protein